MKALILRVVAGGLVGLLAASSAVAQISSIQTQWLDTVQDTTFDGSTLTVQQTITAPFNPVAVNDLGNPNPIDQFASSEVFLETFLVGVTMLDRGNGLEPHGLFQGGSVSVKFDTFEISGPIDTMVVAVNVPGATTLLDAEGLFTAVTTNLPGSGVWNVNNPSGSPFSALDGIIFNVGEDLSNFDWANPVAWTGSAETIFQMLPNDNVTVPEPASVMLLAAGFVGLVSRRRNSR